MRYQILLVLYSYFCAEKTRGHGIIVLHAYVISTGVPSFEANEKQRKETKRSKRRQKLVANKAREYLSPSSPEPSSLAQMRGTPLFFLRSLFYLTHLCAYRPVSGAQVNSQTALRCPGPLTHFDSWRWNIAAQKGTDGTTVLSFGRQS